MQQFLNPILQDYYVVVSMVLWYVMILRIVILLQKGIVTKVTTPLKGYTTLVDFHITLEIFRVGSNQTTGSVFSHKPVNTRGVSKACMEYRIAE